METLIAYGIFYVLSRFATFLLAAYEYHIDKLRGREENMEYDIKLFLRSLIPFMGLFSILSWFIML